MAKKVSVFTVIKKFFAFVSALFSFLCNRNQKDDVVDKVRRYQGVNEEIAEGYSKIDRKKDKNKSKSKNTKKEKKRIEEIEKRLNRMF